MKQLDASMIATVAGGGPIFTPENAGIAAGLGSGAGASFVIEGAGGLAAGTFAGLGTSSIAVLGAAGTGLLASAAAGYGVGTAINEIPGVSTAADWTIEGIMNSVSGFGQALVDLIGTLIGGAGPAGSPWNYVE